MQCLLVISYLLKHLIIRHIDILHTFLKLKNLIHELCSMVFRFNKKKNVSHISNVEVLDEWYDGAKILILSRSNFFQIFFKSDRLKTLWRFHFLLVFVITLSPCRILICISVYKWMIGKKRSLHKSSSSSIKLSIL